MEGPLPPVGSVEQSLDFYEGEYGLVGWGLLDTARPQTSTPQRRLMRPRARL